jgi:hypothetical protein
MTGRKVISVMRLPQIDPPFAEDQRWRDGCMMPPITWPQRVIRQLFPHRDVRDCCYYHRLDWHAIAEAVLAVASQVNLAEPDSDETDDLKYELLEGAGLTDVEHTVAYLLLSEDCGIEIWRPAGQRRWTYQNGRHRARALMDAGVRRIVVTCTDDHDPDG